MHRWCSIAAVSLVVACEGPTASRPDAAYDPTTLTGGVRYRWTSGATVRVWTVSGAPASPIDLGIAVRSAMTQWNRVRQFAEFTLTAASSIGDADIVVYDRDTEMPIAPGSCAFDPRGSAGYTYFCPGGGAPPRAERLRPPTTGGAGVAVVIRVDRGRVTSQGGYNAVVAHEFGHALGIGAHSDVPSDLMFGLPTVDVPSARDVATLRSVLGALADLIL